MMDGEDAEIEALEAAVSALADSAGTTLKPGHSSLLAMLLIKANNDPIAAQKAKFYESEALIEAARAFVRVFDGVSDDVADEFCADYAITDSLRGMRQVAERPRPKIGRPPRLDALQVASRALTVFEIITKKTPGVTVDPISGTASGAYLGLVAEAFRILSIKASPEHYAKEAIRENRTFPSAG